MTTLINDIQNNALAAIARRAPQNVIGAIKQASSKTGVNFAYLVQQAGAESSFNPTAKAKTSSATGLYQFIERTWLSMVDKYGDKHGLETDGKTRGDILNMRKDPRAASLMAAEFAGENERFLKAHYGGEIGSTELYFAHFLGAGGASAFLNARAEDPGQKAAYLFPAAAKANKGVFYDRSTGRAKSLEEVYAYFDKKFSVKDSAPVQMAEAQPARKNAISSADGVNALLEIYGKQDISSSVVRRSANNPMGLFNVTHPVEIMLLAELEAPLRSVDEKREEQNSRRTNSRTNSLYSHNRSYNN
jgi:hypothetical protein